MWSWWSFPLLLDPLCTGTLSGCQHVSTVRHAARCSSSSDVADALPLPFVLCSQLEVEQLLTMDQLEKGCAALHQWSPKMDPTQAYFGQANCVLRTSLGPASLLQCGWLDAVGVYKKGSVPAELMCCTADQSLLAFDHVAVKGTVHIHKGIEPACTVCMATLCGLYMHGAICMGTVCMGSVCMGTVCMGTVCMGGIPCAARALCEKLAVLHHREFGKFRRLKGHH